LGYNPDTETDRFQAISELIGTGRIQELKGDLMSARKKWKKNVNQLKETIDDKRKELKNLRAELDSLGQDRSESMESLQQDWDDWWSTARDLGVESMKPGLKESNAGTALDEAVKAIAEIKRSVVRRRDEIQTFHEEVQNTESDPDLPDLQPLKQRLAEAKRRKSAAKEQLERARRRTAEQREKRIRQEEEDDELGALAKIALDYIDGRCPVCQQQHDIDETREHLKKLIAQSDLDQESDEDDYQRIEDALENLESCESDVVEANEALDDAKKRHKDHEKWLEIRNNKIDNLDLDIDNSEDRLENVLNKELDNIEGKLQRLEMHREEGESLAMRVATMNQEVKRSRIKEKVEEKEKEVRKREKEYSDRQEAWELAKTVTDKLKDATGEFVSSRLSDISPLFQQVYSKVEPHKTFRVVDIISEFYYGKGRLNPVIEDPRRGGDKLDPFSYMSSSQVNVIALSIFLAMNLGLNKVPLKTLILDDPLQSLDDVNLLGLVDLLRRARDKRQIFFSTHDRRLSNLLHRKLRPVRDSHRTLIFTLRDWDRSGPTIERTEVERQEEVMHLVPS
jgi:DNA repair exonuclease SbcCD ATPase subunit